MEEIPETPNNLRRFLCRLSGSETENKNESKKFENEFFYDEEERQLLVTLYGRNEISLPEIRFIKLFFTQLFSPFFIFQRFAAAVWFAMDFFYFAIILKLVISLPAAYFNASEELHNLESLRSLVGAKTAVRMIAYKYEKEDGDSKDG